jgi:hypothetical protein
MDYFKQCDEKACPRFRHLVLELPSKIPSTFWSGKWRQWFSGGFYENGRVAGLVFDGKTLEDRFKEDFGRAPKNYMESVMYGLALFEKRIADDAAIPIGGTFMLEDGSAIWIRYAEIARVIDQHDDGYISVDMSDGEVFIVKADFDDMCKRANQRPTP